MCRKQGVFRMFEGGYMEEKCLTFRHFPLFDLSISNSFLEKFLLETLCYPLKGVPVYHCYFKQLHS